jgi:hypothetical protein
MASAPAFARYFASASRMMNIRVGNRHHVAESGNRGCGSPWQRQTRHVEVDLNWNV